MLTSLEELKVLLGAALVVLVALAIVVAAAVFLFRSVGGTYFRFRGKRLIRCPENHQPAAVDVDARHAAATCALGATELRLSSCSRWPEKKDCGQECLAQIEQAPEECLVRNILEKWYAGKSCAFCGKPVQDMGWHEHKPGFVSPEGRTLLWQDVRAENLPGVLETHKPVCWNCHIAETFRREHPELVIDR